jgi:hypothetical protein
MRSLFGSASRGDGASKAYSTIDYIHFIEGSGKTGHGRSFDEIMKYSDQQLENDHQYIQWIFPLPAASMFNSTSPVIDVKELQKYPQAKEAILGSYEKLTKFWGIYENPVDAQRITLLNGHNGLRFSRFLQSMVYHNQADLAERTLDVVKANLSLLSPTLGRSGKTLWEELFLKAKETMRKIHKETESSET